MSRTRQKPRKDERYVGTPPAPRAHLTASFSAGVVSGYLEIDGITDREERDRVLLAIDFGETYYSVSEAKQWYASFARKAGDVKVVLSEIAERLNLGPRARCWYYKVTGEILFSFGIEEGTTDGSLADSMGPSAEFIRALFAAHPDVKVVNVFQNLPERSIKREYKRIWPL